MRGHNQLQAAFGALHSATRGRVVKIDLTTVRKCDKRMLKAAHDSCYDEPRDWIGEIVPYIVSSEARKEVLHHVRAYLYHH